MLHRCYGEGSALYALGRYWRGAVAEAGMLGVFDMIGAIFLIFILRGGNYGEPPRAESQAASVPLAA